MSQRRGRDWGPSDDELLRVLDRLVEVDGIVKTSERLGVSYRAAANCHLSLHVSRRTPEALGKHVREHGEVWEQREQREHGASTPRADETVGGEGPRLQESEQDLRDEVEARRAEVVDLRERPEAVEGQAARGRGRGDDQVDIRDVDAGDRGSRWRSVAATIHVFPEPITAKAESGEEQVYGAAAEFVVEWREAWVERKSAPCSLHWLRAERRLLDLELRLIGVFGLTPPSADAPWREPRRAHELDWHRRALRRFRWQLRLTGCVHWLLRLLTLGRWGESLNSCVPAP